MSSADFQSPCVSLVECKDVVLPHYSDISDEENDFEQPMDVAKSKYV